jgi:hypothetical protein
VIAAQEATLLQALPADRIAALTEAAANAQSQLSAIQAPDCLRDAHLAAVESAAHLSRALESVASGDYPAADEALRDSFEQAAQALALIGTRYWEQTPMPRVSP